MSGPLTDPGPRVGSNPSTAGLRCKRQPGASWPGRARRSAFPASDLWRRAAARRTRRAVTCRSRSRFTGPFRLPRLRCLALPRKNAARRSVHVAMISGLSWTCSTTTRSTPGSPDKRSGSAPSKDCRVPKPFGRTRCRCRMAPGSCCGSSQGGLRLESAEPEDHTWSCATDRTRILSFSKSPTSARGGGIEANGAVGLSDHAHALGLVVATSRLRFASTDNAADTDRFHCRWLAVTVALKMLWPSQGKLMYRSQQSSNRRRALTRDDGIKLNRDRGVACTAR